jgi:hypothetical protein
MGIFELAIVLVLGTMCLGGLAAIVGLVVWLVVRASRKDQMPPPE